MFIEDKENYLRCRNIEEVRFLQDSKGLYDAVSQSPFKRVYIFTNINEQEMLLIIGDIHSGPFYFGEGILNRHYSYMDKLFDNNESKIKEDYGQNTYYPKTEI